MKDEQRGIYKPPEREASPWYTPPRPKGWVDPNSPSGNRYAPPLDFDQERLAEAMARAISRTIQSVELVPTQGVPFRGERWEADSQSGVIIMASDSGASDAGTSADAVASATGATFTEGDGAVNIRIASYRVPDGHYAMVSEVAVRADSEIGYRLIDFSLRIGGRKVLVLNVRANAFDRDGAIPVHAIAGPGQLVDIVATNNDAEAAHLCEAAIRGWRFPVDVVSDSLKGLIQKSSSGG